MARRLERAGETHDGTPFVCFRSDIETKQTQSSDFPKKSSLFLGKRRKLSLPPDAQILSDHQKAGGKSRSESALQLSDAGTLRLLRHLLVPLRNVRLSAKTRGQWGHRRRSDVDQKIVRYHRREKYTFRSPL